MIEQPPIQPTPVGALRFNTDSKQLEYFDGGQYVNITTDSPNRNTGGTRRLMAEGVTAGTQGRNTTDSLQTTLGRNPRSG